MTSPSRAGSRLSGNRNVLNLTAAPSSRPILTERQHHEAAAQALSRVPVPLTRLTRPAWGRIVPAATRGRKIMKVGVALNMLCQAGRSDASVVAEHLVLGDLAEPLGFDSIFALEHHFTGYAMSPAPTQLLAYYAG